MKYLNPKKKINIHFKSNNTSNLSISPIIIPYNYKHKYISKNDIINWIHKPIGNNMILYEYILVLFNTILNEIDNKKLIIRQDKNTFLLNFIYFLYCNSNTKINI